MSKTIAIAKMPNPGDGLRKKSIAVPIPSGTNYIGLGVPALNANSAITVDVGNGPTGYLWDAECIAFGGFRANHDANLVAYYTFDGPSSTGTKDHTVNTNDLTVNGNPTFGTGEIPQHGYPVTFDGTGDYLSLASASATGLDVTTNDFSVMAVIKMDATASKMVIASKKTGSDGSGAGWEMGIAATTSYPYLTITDASGSATITGGAAVDDSKAYVIHFAVDRSGTGQCYIDGSASGSAGTVSARALTLTNTREFRLGADGAATAANLFTGSLYQFAMWIDIRTAAEAMRDATGGFMPVVNPVTGSYLYIAASTVDPAYFELTPYVSGAAPALRLACGTGQTTGSTELDFQVYFSE